MTLKLTKDYKTHVKGSIYQTDDTEAQWLIENGYTNQTSFGAGYSVKVEIPRAENKMIDTSKRKVKRGRKNKKYN